jgi:hypothetical protein
VLNLTTGVFAGIPNGGIQHESLVIPRQKSEAEVQDSSELRDAGTSLAVCRPV